MEFVGDGIPLGKIGIELTNESGDSGGVSGKIRSVSASENAGDGDQGEAKEFAREVKVFEGGLKVKMVEGEI